MGVFILGADAAHMTRLDATPLAHATCHLGPVPSQHSSSLLSLPGNMICQSLPGSHQKPTAVSQLPAQLTGDCGPRFARYGGHAAPGEILEVCKMGLAEATMGSSDGTVKK